MSELDSAAISATTRRFARAAPHAELVTARFGESVDAKRQLLEPRLVAQVGRLADVMVRSMSAGGKVILFGNGGSAADATHLAAELVGRFSFDRPPLPALSLTDNTSSLSAIGNDYGYDESFARQIRGLGRPGDVAVGLSTSGTWTNVVRGVEAASETGLRTAAITCAGGGALRGVAELCLEVPATATPRVQECTMLIGHTVCEIIEAELFGS